MPLLSGIEHLISVVVRNAAEWQVPFLAIPNQFFCFLSLNATQKALGGVKGNEAGVSSRYKQK